MHYSELIYSLISVKNESDKFIFFAGDIEYEIDESGNIVDISQTKGTNLTRKSYKFLAAVTNLDSEIPITLNKNSRRKWEKLISRYGYVKTFSSPYRQYIESQITEIFLKKSTKQPIRVNHNSSCVFIQSFEYIDDTTFINQAIAEMRNVKLIITNIDGLVPSGDVAFIVKTDGYIPNLSFWSITDKTVSVNHSSRYYRSEDYDFIIDNLDVKKISIFNKLHHNMP
jgi:hypothetical protein